MDYSALLLAPVYRLLGVAVTFTPAETGVSYTMTMIDKSAGVVNEFGGLLSQELVPAAIVRMRELTDAGLTRDDINAAVLVMNAKTWRVETHRMKPTPGGEADGEVFLFLAEVT